VVNSWDRFEVRVADPDNDIDLGALSTLRFAWRARERDEVGLIEDAFADAFAIWLQEHRASHVGFLGTLGTAPVAMGWLAIVDRVPGPGVFERRCAYVQSVYVTPERRQQGLGAALMNELISYARDLGLDYLAVHPSAEAFNFYERLGFAGTSKVLELDFRSARHA
jgi:GNAT superfamily N-acetyltransferase